MGLANRPKNGPWWVKGEMRKRSANILHEAGIGLGLGFEYGDGKILNKQRGSVVVGTRGWRKTQIYHHVAKSFYVISNRNKREEKYNKTLTKFHI